MQSSIWGWKLQSYPCPPILDKLGKFRNDFTFLLTPTYFLHDLKEKLCGYETKFMS